MLFLEITLKLAVDSFGAVDDLSGKSGRFTSPTSLDAVHRLRRHCDAVLVGVGTVIRDDPSLTVRRVPCDKQPLRVVVDPNGRIPPRATLLTDGLPTVILDGLDSLNEHGIDHLMVEGGPITARHFLDASLVDRAIIFRANNVCFRRPVPSGIDDAALRKAGLSLRSRRHWDGDDVEMWTKDRTPEIWDAISP